MDRESEIVQLSAVYSTPVRQRYVLHVSQAAYIYWSSKGCKKFGEVVMFIRRSNGRVLLHTKDFYPAGTFRVPSGTILEQESLLDAVYREAWEETGLQVRIERFLAALEFEFCCQGQTFLIPSYLFLLREVQGQLQVQDENEHITAFAEVAPVELVSVAQKLESLPADWRDWGRFRSIPHRLAAELLQDIETRLL